LGVAGLKPNRSAEAAGDHRLRRDDESVGERHAPAIERIGFDRVDGSAELAFSEPDKRQAEQDASDGRYGRLYRIGKGEHRRKPAARLDAIEQPVQVLHHLAHRRDQNARHHPDHAGQHDHDNAARLQKRE